MTDADKRELRDSTVTPWMVQVSKWRVVPPFDVAYSQVMITPVYRWPYRLGDGEPEPERKERAR